MIPAEYLLEDWELLRSDGVDIVTAATRIGTTPIALDRALHRALDRGDDRGRHTGCSRVRAWAAERHRVESERRAARTEAARSARQAEADRLYDLMVGAIPQIVAALAEDPVLHTLNRVAGPGPQSEDAIARCDCGSWRVPAEPCPVCAALAASRHRVDVA